MFRGGPVSGLIQVRGRVGERSDSRSFGTPRWRNYVRASSFVTSAGLDCRAEPVGRGLLPLIYLRAVAGVLTGIDSLRCTNSPDHA